MVIIVTALAIDSSFMYRDGAVIEPSAWLSHVIFHTGEPGAMLVIAPRSSVIMHYHDTQLRPAENLKVYLTVLD